MWMSECQSMRYAAVTAVVGNGYTAVMSPLSSAPSPTVTPDTNVRPVMQEAQLSLRNRPTLAHADIKILTQNATSTAFHAVLSNSCPLVNDCDLLAALSDFYLSPSHLMPSPKGTPSSYRVHIWYVGKLE